MSPRSFAFLLFTCLLVGCDSGEADVPLPQPMPPDSVVAGVNLNQLFAAPTASERSFVRADWTGRDNQLPNRYTFTLEESVTAVDGAELNVYAGREAGSNQVLFYGLARLPIRPPGDVAQRPTLLILPDGTNGTSDLTITSNGLPIRSDLQEDYVYALMAYRGESLRAGSETFSSTAPTVAYNFDADDAIAFVNHIRNAELLADPSRVGAIGLGRGGTVALLAAARIDPFDIVIDLAGPANFFSDSFESITRALLNDGTGGDFPAASALSSQVLHPLRDGTLSMADARIELLKRSPSHFVGPPPFLFVAHGVLDFTVNIDHSRAISSLSGNPSALFLQVENADHVSVRTNPEVVALTAQFLEAQLGGP